MNADVSPAMPSPQLLVKIERDLRDNEHLLVQVAATTLLSQMPQAVDVMRRKHVQVKPSDYCHPTQLGTQRPYREMEPSDPVLKTGLWNTYYTLHDSECTTSLPRLSTIEESCEEE